MNTKERFICELLNKHVKEHFAEDDWRRAPLILAHFELNMRTALSDMYDLGHAEGLKEAANIGPRDAVSKEMDALRRAVFDIRNQFLTVFEHIKQRNARLFAALLDLQQCIDWTGQEAHRQIADAAIADELSYRAYRL